MSSISRRRASGSILGSVTSGSAMPSSDLAGVKSHAHLQIQTVAVFDVTGQSDGFILNAQRRTTHTTLSLSSAHRARRSRQYGVTADQRCPSYRRANSEKTRGCLVDARRPCQQEGVPQSGGGQFGLRPRNFYRRNCPGPQIPEQAVRASLDASLTDGFLSVTVPVAHQTRRGPVAHPDRSALPGSRCQSRCARW
jgi:hypothetical protein